MQWEVVVRPVVCYEHTNGFLAAPRAFTRPGAVVEVQGDQVVVLDARGREVRRFMVGPRSVLVKDPDHGLIWMFQGPPGVVFKGVHAEGDAAVFTFGKEGEAA